MVDIATTKLSSRGQVVIPEEIRSKLKLKPGAKFIVVGEKDAVILKTISAPALEEFGHLIAKARKSARQAGLKRADIDSAVPKVRKK